MENRELIEKFYISHSTRSAESFAESPSNHLVKPRSRIRAIGYPGQVQVQVIGNPLALVLRSF